MPDLKEQKYRQVFEATVAQLTMRRRSDPHFTINELEQLLQSEYIHQGNDWVGKGSLADIVSGATIAAYESFLADWQNEKDKN